MTIFDELDGRVDHDVNEDGTKKSDYNFNDISQTGQFNTFTKRIQKKVSFLRQDNVNIKIIVNDAKKSDGSAGKTIRVIFGHCDHNL